MGATYVDVKVTNPRSPEKTWDGKFMVDTGATDCIMPRSKLEAIGLSPERQRTYELADGSKVECDVAQAQLDFMGENCVVNVAFGDEDAVPLLGYLSLEATFMEVDPARGQLKKHRDSGYMVGIRRVED